MVSDVDSRFWMWVLLFVLLGLIAVLQSLAASFEDIVNEWAKEQGYEVLNMREGRESQGVIGRRAGAPFEAEFYVTVKDKKGEVRSGWLVFSSERGIKPYKFQHIQWDSQKSANPVNETTSM